MQKLQNHQAFNTGLLQRTNADVQNIANTSAAHQAQLSSRVSSQLDNITKILNANFAHRWGPQEIVLQSEPHLQHDGIPTPEMRTTLRKDRSTTSQARNEPTSPYSAIPTATSSPVPGSATTRTGSCSSRTSTTTSATPIKACVAGVLYTLI